MKLSHIKFYLRLIVFVGVIILFAFIPQYAQALYDWQKENSYGDVRGMLRGFGMVYHNPEKDFFYDKRTGAGVAAIARLISQSHYGENLAFNLNVYQTFVPASLSSGQGDFGTILDVERSAVLEWSFSNDQFINLAIDHLNARWTFNQIDITIGRQPVNLATTFYFTPNDFFAPFSAQTFYRVYKAGVDAARAEVQLGALSQLSFISVLGYKEEPESDTGWSNSPTSNRASYLGRFSMVTGNFEWVIIGGVVHDINIMGFALQGELFDWIGLRAEGHIADPDNFKKDHYSEVSIGMEHRWENSLEIRFEQFYHGSGANSVSHYGDENTYKQTDKLYLGKYYSAIGATYEFTPLLTGNVIAVTNWIDNSALLSFNSIYSLSDEAELAVNFSLPLGQRPDKQEIESEFGMYPYTINIELRCYF